MVALASAAITAVAAGSALTVVDPAPRERAEVTSAGSAPAESPAAPASPTPPPEKPEEPVTPSPDPAPPTRLGTPDPRVVRAALEFSPLVRYHRDLPGGAYTNAGNTGGHTYVLAFAARAGDTSVDARLLEQIRHILTGGNDIAANGGYPSQHELQVTGVLSVAKRIPRIWNRLTGEERARADATMTASLIANAFTTSDHNPYLLAGTRQHTLDGDSNVGRDYNPNYREGMAGSVLVAAAYFGVANARERLAHYDHEEFVAELAARGLSNAYTTFTWRATHPGSPAPTGEQIERAVRDWTLRGVGLDDPMRIYADLTAHTYGLTDGTVIECGYDGGRGVPDQDAPGGVAGVIDQGCDGLPHAGQSGQLLEFSSSDAGGARSSAEYAYGGFKPNLFTRLALIDAGIWDPDAELRQILAAARRGVEDLWYKLEHGYREYSSGRFQGVLRIDDPEFGFAFLRSLWEDVYLPGATSEG